ncbi:MAG: allantoinase AllB [Terrimicrobiaceae bacterium]
MSNLILRNAQLVLDSGIIRGEVAVEDGVITEVGPAISEVSAMDLDVCGAFVFPGFIDAHVHFNEPGREQWEGLSTGSAALAAGGGTTFFDMPLNSDPPVLNADEFHRKRKLAEEKSLLDFALWGGLCPGQTDAIDGMAEAGAVGFKAFLCDSGIAEFPATDAATLRAGMTRAKRWNLPVAVHAESPEVLAGVVRNTTDTSMRAFLDSRPKEAEVAAIRMACEIAGETGAALHVVHVSCAEGLAEIDHARKSGVDVSAETCPHYLLFNTDDAIRIGARAKCAPPLREKEDVAALWKSLLAGQVDTIGSDHSPAPLELKNGEDFFQIWGGISGCQHAFPAFLGELRRRAPKQFAKAAGWLAANPASRFGFGKRKGRIAVGYDADFALVDFRKAAPIEGKTLLTKHPLSLYESHHSGCHVIDVVRRGKFLVQRGEITQPTTRGIFLRPTHE